MKYYVHARRLLHYHRLHLSRGQSHLGYDYVRPRCEPVCGRPMSFIRESYKQRFYQGPTESRPRTNVLLTSYTTKMTTDIVENWYEFLSYRFQLVSTALLQTVSHCKLHELTYDMCFYVVA